MQFALESTSEESRTGGTNCDIFYLNSQYYQKLGEVWDHETKDFKVLYKPLYCCGSKEGSFEAHHLATSTFERWERKFIPLERCEEFTDLSSLPEEVRGHLVSRGSVHALTGGNPSLPLESSALPGPMQRGSAKVTTTVAVDVVPSSSSSSGPAAATCRSHSGFGSRSLEPYYIMDFAPEFQQIIIEGKKKATTRVLKPGVPNGEPSLLRIVDALAQQQAKQREEEEGRAGAEPSVEIWAVSDSGSDQDPPPVVFARLGVTAVQTTLFSQLTPELAALEQFPGVDSFQACLRKFYPWIGDDDEVHVFYFDVKC